MPWLTLTLGLAFLLCVGIGIWRHAYRLGFKHGSTGAVPFHLVDELLDHRIQCRQQDPATARIEVGTLLGIHEWQTTPLRNQLTTNEHDIPLSHVYN
ncbi:MAG: hypothetical protein AB7G75_23475 [Candidatus Binatia bacterium]